MTSSEKIAIISVSDTLTHAINDVMRQRGVQYPLQQAKLDEAVDVARRYQKMGIHVFISRGRTATYLQEHLSDIVVNIRSAFFGYAVAIRDLQRQGAKKIAVLGFSDQFHHNESKFKDIWDEDVIFASLDWRGKDDGDLEEEFSGLIRRLKAEGVDSVIGNHMIRRAARRMGLTAAPHLPDADEIVTAMEEAEYVASSLAAHEEKSQTVSTILNIVSEIAVKIDPDGLITAFNPAAQKFLHLSNSHKTKLKEIFPTLDWSGFCRTPTALRETVLSFHQQPLVFDLVPIFTGKLFSGAVMTAQPVSHIQDLEQNIRAKIVQKGLVAKNTFDDILGTSPAILCAVDRAKRIAATESTVLITGETGTGKEIFAQSIHNYSRRARGPFVAINCAALAPSVLESELFGYVKGAFTGALSEGRQGIFEMAHNGSIFLDEVGELPLDIQAKLLRVIQEKEVVRIGGSKVIPVNVRIIAATNRDLEEETAQGRFRPDLFYRLSVLTIHIPVLAKRKEDIRVLAQYFLSQISPSKKLSPDALALLEDASWPGNVRQLGNVVERISVFTEHDLVDAGDIKDLLPVPAAASAPSRPARGTALDGEQIREALISNGGKRAETARSLGISTATLWRKMSQIEGRSPGFFAQFSIGRR